MKEEINLKPVLNKFKNIKNNIKSLLLNSWQKNKKNKKKKQSKE